MSFFIGTFTVWCWFASLPSFSFCRSPSEWSKSVTAPRSGLCGLFDLRFVNSDFLISSEHPNDIHLQALGKDTCLKKCVCHCQRIRVVLTHSYLRSAWSWRYSGILRAKELYLNTAKFVRGQNDTPVCNTPFFFDNYVLPVPKPGNLPWKSMVHAMDWFRLSTFCCWKLSLDGIQKEQFTRHTSTA